MRAPLDACADLSVILALGLSGWIPPKLDGSIRLYNGVAIAVHSNSFKTVRGRTLLCAIFDEIAMW